jgi:hypothetical protein
MAGRFLGFGPLAGFIVAIVFVLVAVFSTLPVLADFRILSSSGGEVSSYLAVFARVRQSGDRVIIDGPCLSACTLVLSTIPKNRICVTRRAVLGFHAPKVTGGDAYRDPVLSVGGAYVDQEARRAHAEAHLPSRKRACCSLSALLGNLLLFKSSRGDGRKHPRLWCG